MVKRVVTEREIKMSFNTIKATLLKYHDLSWNTLTEIKKWFGQSSRSRDGFTMDSFVNNRKLQVATATNSVGQNIAHCLIEPCYMFSAYVLNPEATEIEQRRAGDVIDGALAHLAQKEGVQKLLLLLPDSYPSQPEEKWVRIVERQVPQIAAIQGMGCNTHSPAFIN